MRFYQIPYAQALLQIYESRVSQEKLRVYVFLNYHIILIAEAKTVGDSWLCIFLRNYN